MTQRLVLGFVLFVLACGGASMPYATFAQQELIPGKRLIVKPNTLAKFLAKGTFPLPAEPANDPSLLGATIRFADTAPGGAGDVTFPLPAQNWHSLGKPGGATGFKYRGTGAPDDPCKVVLIKETVVKAVCKGAAVALMPPAVGSVAVELTVGTTPRRYCAEFTAAQDTKNEAKILKRQDAPAPASCVGTQPSATATPATGVPSLTPTRSATPTVTPTGGSASCANGLFEPGETCAGCPVDCQIGPCNSPGAPTQTFRVDFAPPPFQAASSITVRIGYRDDRTNIPGSANAATVGARIVQRQSGSTVTPNDLDYALRVVYSRAGGINTGKVFALNFDTCASALPVTIADFTCFIEGCSSSSGPLSGCACSVATP